MPKRVDANQPEIVAALRAAGCSVCCIHTVGYGCPDLLVGRSGQNYLLEVKSARGVLSPYEVSWHASWRGQVVIVRSVEEAFAACGIEFDKQGDV